MQTTVYMTTYKILSICLHAHYHRCSYMQCYRHVYMQSMSICANSGNYGYDYIQSVAKMTKCRQLSIWQCAKYYRYDYMQIIIQIHVVRYRVNHLTWQLTLHAHCVVEGSLFWSVHITADIMS
jgi:hypothetical protein